MNVLQVFFNVPQCPDGPWDLLPVVFFFFFLNTGRGNKISILCHVNPETPSILDPLLKNQHHSPLNHISKCADIQTCCILHIVRWKRVFLFDVSQNRDSPAVSDCHALQSLVCREKLWFPVLVMFKRLSFSHHANPVTQKQRGNHGKTKVWPFLCVPNTNINNSVRFYLYNAF